MDAQIRKIAAGEIRSFFLLKSTSERVNSANVGRTPIPPFHFGTMSNGTNNRQHAPTTSAAAQLVPGTTPTTRLRVQPSCMQKTQTKCINCQMISLSLSLTQGANLGQDATDRELPFFPLNVESPLIYVGMEPFCCCFFFLFKDRGVKCSSSNRWPALQPGQGANISSKRRRALCHWPHCVHTAMREW